MSEIDKWIVTLVSVFIVLATYAGILAAGYGIYLLLTMFISQANAIAVILGCIAGHRIYFIRQFVERQTNQ